MSSIRFLTLGSLVVGLLATAGTAYAASSAEVATAASAVAADKAAVKPAVGKVVVGKVVVKVPATAGGVVSKGGEREYPSGNIPIPPKPKKEVLETGAIKAKAAQP